MEQIKVGKAFEDDATTINQVAQALDTVNIKLMATDDTFRPMGDVLDELAGKWDTLSQKQQNMIAGTVAGIRQMPQFLTLMQNWSQVTKALAIEQDSGGLAAQRYQIFLQGLEAAANKFTATWQKLVSGTATSGQIKSFIDFGTALVNLVDKFGLVNIAIVLFATVMAAKVMFIIPVFTQSIYVMALAMGVATGAATALATALSGGILGIAIVGLIAVFNKLNVSVVDTYNNFEKLKVQAESNKSELEGLATEYDALANKQNRSAEDNARLLDLQTIITVKYGASKAGIDLYSAAINGNSIAIQKNIEWLKLQAAEQAKNFLNNPANIKAYKEALDTLYKPRPIPIEIQSAATRGKTNVPDAKNLEEYMDILANRIIKEGDIGGLLQKQYNQLLEEKEAAQNIEIETKRYKNLLNEIAKIDPPRFWDKGELDNIKEFGKSAEMTADQIKDAFGDIGTIIQDSFGNAYDNYKEQQDAAIKKTEELRTAIENVSKQPVTTEQQTQLGDLQFELDNTEYGLYKLAQAYEKSTQIAIINLMIQRIELANLGPAAQAAALGVVTGLAQAWGLMSNATASAVTAVDAAISQLEADVANGGANATAIVENLRAALLRTATRYDATIVVTTVYQTAGGATATATAGAGVQPERKNYPGYVPPGSSGGGGGGGGGGAKQEEQISAAKLLAQIIDLIKEQKKAEIDLLKAKQDANKLEQEHLKDQQKALDTQLDKYRDIIDARKDIIRTQEEELSYQEEIEGKNKSIAQIQNELAVLALDTSEESKARQLELQSDLGKELEDLAKTQRQHSVDEQEKALDKEYSLYETNINKQKENLQGQIDLIDKQNELIDKQIEVINDYLSKSGLVAQDAIKMMVAKAPELYNKLIAWNKIYGTGIDADITRAWNEAYKALAKYKSLADALYGKSKYDTKPKKSEAHHTGLESGPAGGYDTPTGTVFAELMMGERVLNERDMFGIMQVRLPQLANAMNSGDGKGVNLHIDNLINVQGNVDKDVIGDLDRITNSVIGKINGALLRRGYTRGAQVFST